MSCRAFQILGELLNEEKHPTLTGRELGRIYLLRNCPELYIGWYGSAIGYDNPDFPVRKEENWDITKPSGNSPEWVEIDIEKYEFETENEERRIYAKIRHFGQFVKRKRPAAQYQLNAAKYRAARLIHRLDKAILGMDATAAIKAAGGEIPETIKNCAIGHTIKELADNKTLCEGLESYFSDVKDIIRIASNLATYNYSIKEAQKFYNIPEMKYFTVDTGELKTLITDYSTLRKEFEKRAKNDTHSMGLFLFHFKPIDLKKITVPKEEKEEISQNIRAIEKSFFLSADMIF